MKKRRSARQSGAARVPNKQRVQSPRAPAPRSSAKQGARAVLLAVLAGTALAAAVALALRSGWGGIAQQSGPYGDAGPTAPVYKAEVVERFAHSREAFTQGLVWHSGKMFESTGLFGKSSLREIDLKTGKVLRRHDLAKQDFGEGLAAVDGADTTWLVQLLWKNRRGYVYDMETFEVESSFPLDTDAWGLAVVSSGTNELLMSNGTSTIRVFRLESGSLREVRSFKVYDGNREVGMLNDLEVINGELWANVWPCELIARINLRTGRVSSWVDLRYSLRQSEIPAGHEVDVLNGITHDPSTGTIYVTGKMWPRILSIRPTMKKTARTIEQATKAFFLDPHQVDYALKKLLV